MSSSQHSSGHSGSLGQTNITHNNLPSDITKMGYLKKMKTMKKKFFVVRSGSRYNPPRLEYYDTEKKFRAGLGAKRTIDLSQCFSVNKRSDSKHKFGIVVYTKDDSFSVLADNSEERDHWFNEILEAFKEGICDTDHANHHYECVWPVTVQNRGLGNSRLLHGHYRLCLSEEAVCLVKVNAIIPDVTFQLRLIRRCGHTNAVFFMEVGRSSVTGEGELWMGVEDTAMAQTMHDVILSAMKNQSSFRGGSGSSGPITVPQQPQEVPRIRTTSMGSPRRPHVVVAEKPRPKSLFTKSPSATTSRSPATPTISHFGTSPLSPADFPDSGRIRSNSIDSHESHSAVSCEASDGSPVDHHFSGHMGERTVTPEPPQPPGPEYLVMTPGTSASASSSARSSRERLNSMGSSSADTGAIPESYMEMAPGEATSVSSPHLPPDTYMDMSPLAADQAPGISGGDDSYAFMGGYQRGTKSGPSSMKSGQPSYKSGPGSNKSAPGGFKSPPSGYKSGPGSHKSGPASVKSGPSSVKSMSSVEGRDDGYIDMEPGSDTMSPGIDLRSPGYFSMSSTGQSPKMDHMPEMRPDKVYSYLSDDSFSGDTPHVRTYSVGSKTTMTKPTLTYQAYQETVAKQGKLSNSKSSSAPHLIPPKPGRQLQSESPTPPATMSYVNSPTGPMSKSFKSDDSDSFMELDFCRPRTASDCYSYRRRAGSFGQAQTQHNHGYLQNFRERASSYGHSSKPVLLKRISSESVRTTSQELFRKSSMDSLHKGSKESLRSSQESLRKAVLDSRQRGSIQADYMEMSSDKIRSVSEKKPVYISGRKQLKVDESKGVKEYFDMTLGSPTQSHMHVTDPIQQVVTSPVTVKLTAPDTYMEMTPDHGADSKPGKSESSRKEADTLVYGSPPVAGNNVPVNPYVNMSYDSDGNPSKSQPHGMFSSQTANVVHARQSSSPAVLESAPVHSSTDSNKTLSPDAAFYSHKNPARHHYPKPKSPIPRSPLAEEDRDTYLSFSPGNVTESSSKQSDTKKQPASYHGPKKNSKLSPKSPDILREESDSSYMSFSSDGSLSDSKNSDLCYPRGSHRMRHSHRKSETVREESDGYISFSPVNVQSEDEKKSQDEAKSHKRYHPKFDFKKDAQKSKKAPGSLTKPSTVEEGYMSFTPSVVVDGETEKAFGDTSDNRAKSDFVTGVVSSNIKTWKTPKQAAPNKDDESGYLEFSPVGTSSDKESKSKTSTTASSSENVKASSKKKYSAEYVQQRRARKVSSGSKVKTSPTEAKPPTPLCTEACQKSQPSTTTTSDLASDYANMSLPETRESDTKVVAPITRPIFDPSKVPKSPRSAGNLERGVLKSPRQNSKHGSDKGSQGEKGSNVSTSPLVTGSRASERSRKVSCDSMKGSLGTNPGAAVSQATVSSQGQLPKRGSTPNIPSFADNPGPCTGAVTSMLPGDRHSYSEPSSSDLAVCGGLTPTSGSNSRHSSRTSLNSLAGKETLNYASLDLGSSDNMTSVTEGGITFLSASTAGPASRTRHASGQEPQEAPPFYAQIDFKKCEELKNSKR